MIETNCRISLIIVRAGPTFRYRVAEARGYEKEPESEAKLLDIDLQRSPFCIYCRSSR